MTQKTSLEQEPTPSPPWSDLTRYFVLLLLITAGIAAAILAAPLLQALGIAALIAILLNPVVGWVMRRLHVSRTPAAAIVFGFLLLIVIGLPVGAGSLAVTQVDDLSADLIAATDELGLWLLQPVIILGYRLEPAAFLTNIELSLSDTLAAIPGGSLSFLSSFTTNLLWILTAVVMLFYFLKDGPKIRPWLVERVPPEQRTEFELLFDRVSEIWGKFLRIQLLLFLVLIVLFALGTLLVVLLFRSGLVRWSLLGFVLLLLAVYTAVQQVDNLWLRPQYMGRSLQLHPAIAFVSLMAGLAFGGLLGALVSIPAVATARILGSYVYRKLIGLNPWTSRTLQFDTRDTEVEAPEAAHSAAMEEVHPDSLDTI